MSIDLFSREVSPMDDEIATEVSQGLEGVCKCLSLTRRFLPKCPTTQVLHLE